MITHISSFQGKHIYGVSTSNDAGMLVTVGPTYTRFYSLYVSPNKRNQGEASQLMSEAIALFGEKPIYIEVDSFDDGLTDEQLREFYAKFGFVSIAKSLHPFAMYRP